MSSIMSRRKQSNPKPLLKSKSNQKFFIFFSFNTLSDFLSLFFRQNPKISFEMACNKENIKTYLNIVICDSFPLFFRFFIIITNNVIIYWILQHISDVVCYTLYMLCVFYDSIVTKFKTIYQFIYMKYNDEEKKMEK